MSRKKVKSINKVRHLLRLAIISFFSIFLCSVQVNAESLPGLLVIGYEISAGEAVEGGSFELSLKIKNFSISNNAYNILVSVSNEEDLIYSGDGMVNQGYIASIAPNGTATLTLSLQLADIAPDIVKTKISLSFVDVNNIINSNDAFIWIPVETKGNINISEFTISENILSGDKARVNMIFSNAGDSNISTIRMHLVENGNEILNEMVTKRLLVGTTTSFETYIDDLDIGDHEIEAVIEYSSENGKTFSNNPKIFKVQVTENTIAMSEVTNENGNKTTIYQIYGIMTLMFICLIVIVKKIRVKK